MSFCLLTTGKLLVVNGQIAACVLLSTVNLLVVGYVLTFKCLSLPPFTFFVFLVIYPFASSPFNALETVLSLTPKFSANTLSLIKQSPVLF
jgi:ABC-type iron transport system FetAB permease component